MKWPDKVFSGEPVHSEGNIRLLTVNYRNQSSRIIIYINRINEENSAASHHHPKPDSSIGNGMQYISPYLRDYTANDCLYNPYRE